MRDKLVYGLGRAHLISRNSFYNILDYVYSIGIRKLDLADYYGYGLTKQRLNKWLHDRGHNDIYVINKYGISNNLNLKCKNRLTLLGVKFLEKISVIKPAWRMENCIIWEKANENLLHDPFSFNLGLTEALNLVKEYGLDGVAGYNIPPDFSQKHPDFKVQTKFGSQTMAHRYYGMFKTLNFDNKEIFRIILDSHFEVIFTTNKIERLKKLHYEIQRYT